MVASSLARAVVFSTLEESTPAATIASRLRLAILNGILEPGERLPSEAVLAEQFGAAVVTVREALAELRASGLIETRRGRSGGSFVSCDEQAREQLQRLSLQQLSRAELLDLGVAYFANVSAGIEFAARRASDRELARLREVLGHDEVLGESELRRRLGGFHIHIVGLSGSIRLAREHIRIQNEFGPLLWACLSDESESRIVLELSRRTAEHTIQRDHATARALTLEICDRASRWLVRRKNDTEVSHERTQRRDNARPGEPSTP